MKNYLSFNDYEWNKSPSASAPMGENKIKDSTFAMTTVGCAVVDCRGVHSLDPERSRSRKIALIKPSSSQTQK